MATEPKSDSLSTVERTLATLAAEFYALAENRTISLKAFLEKNARALPPVSRQFLEGLEKVAHARRSIG